MSGDPLHLFSETLLVCGRQNSQGGAGDRGVDRRHAFLGRTACVGKPHHETQGGQSAATAADAHGCFGGTTTAAPCCMSTSLRPTNALTITLQQKPFSRPTSRRPGMLIPSVDCSSKA